MQVNIQLRGPLNKYGLSGANFSFTINETITVQSLLDQLAVPISSVSFVSIDGHKAELTVILKGGEDLIVYPRVAGG